MKLSVITLLLSGFILSGCVQRSGQTSPDVQQTPAVSTAENGTTVENQPVRAHTEHLTLPLDQRTTENFQLYVSQLKQQALSEGLDKDTVEEALSHVHFVERVVKADRSQPEKNITLDEYLNKVLPAWKIKQAREKYQQFKEPLSITTSRYGVPERYILALWALESSFGKQQGSEDVISALATLAFEGRREELFVNQLLAAIYILQTGAVPKEKLKGSWAGAMGQPQFMPASYLKYGSDGNGDGYIDIWNSEADVFASIANYLTMEGWVSGTNWGRAVKLPANFDVALAGIKDEQAKTMAQWQQLGVTLPNGSSLPDREWKSWIILPDDKQGRAFIVYENFRVLMHWNRSYYFAISVGMMADRIVR